MSFKEQIEYDKGKMDGMISVTPYVLMMLIGFVIVLVSSLNYVDQQHCEETSEMLRISTQEHHEETLLEREAYINHVNDLESVILNYERQIEETYMEISVLDVSDDRALISIRGEVHEYIIQETVISYESTGE